jgi:hypothetical protein
MYDGYTEDADQSWSVSNPFETEKMAGIFPNIVQTEIKRRRFKRV